MNDKTMGKILAWREVLEWAEVQNGRYFAANYAGSVQALLLELVRELEKKMLAEIRKP